jgi:putative DNA primase/helicase
MLTGNNVSFKGDLGRRVIPCDLDPGVEHPEDREGFIHGDLLSYIATARPRLVAAGLTVLRAYHVAGRPAHARPPKGSFEGWDALVRGSLLWLGAEDPLGAMSRIREEGDADLDALRQALGAWRRAFGEDALTAIEVLEKAASSSELGAPLAALAGGSVSQLDAKRLGYALRKVKGRLVAGLKFESGAPTRTGAKRWQVVGDWTDSDQECR